MAANRDRRSNAGNRLRALLNEEEEMEELFEDEGEDEEFEIEGKEEEDIVDSDFDQESADEEPEGDEESNLNEDPEEAKARKKQQAMLSHLKTGKSSFSIPGAGTPTAGGRAKSARLGVVAKKKPSAQVVPTKRGASASSATTTATTSAAASPAPSAVASMIRIPAEIRKSSRRTTVLNNQETELKLLEYETRKAMQPKREKVVVHKMTQEELLEEAKKTEELNLASLLAFKAMEMEKKKVVKKKEVAMGPFIRYHSFAEWIGHGPLIQALADTGTATPGGTRPPTRPGSRSGSRAGSRAGSVGPEAAPSQHGFGQGVPPQSLAQSLAQSLLQQQQLQSQQEAQSPRSISMSRGSSPAAEGKKLKVDFNGLESGSKTPVSPVSLDYLSQRGDTEMASPSGNSEPDATAASRKVAGVTVSAGATDVPTGALTPAYYATMNMSAGSIARKRKKLHPTQMCGRNWITFMGYDDEDSPINEWSFAENYPERKPICPITGLPAKYKDPKSGIPYANKEAYKILQNVVRHGYVWSNGLNAYCHDVAQSLPKGVPAGMAEALMGGQKVGDGIVLKDGDLVSSAFPGGGGGGYTYRRRQQ
ncbi:Vacuolar protein sorting-associated protein 72 [Mortierella sp. GBA30]|nr:Vacuolar protein sorting-associated protein 72 [Mortierella sp. GBA30]